MANTYYSRPGSSAFATGATPPSAIQASQANMLVVDISMTDSETNFTITHNWGAVSDQNFSLLFPLVLGHYCLINATGTNPPLFVFSYVNSNVVLVSKLVATGSAGTYRFVLVREANPFQ